MAAAGLLPAQHLPQQGPLQRGLGLGQTDVNLGALGDALTSPTLGFRRTIEIDFTSKLASLTDQRDRRAQLRRIDLRSR